MKFIHNAFKKLINFFPEKELNYTHEAALLALACNDGELEKVIQYNKKDNHMIDYSRCIGNTVFHDQNEVYKELMQHDVVRNNGNVQTIKYLMLQVAVSRGNLELVKYMLSDEHPYSIDVNSFNDINIIGILNYKNRPETMKIIEYMIYEKNYYPSYTIRDFMKFNHHEYILNMIDKRDLCNKFQKSIQKLNKPDNFLLNTNNQRDKCLRSSEKITDMQQKIRHKI